MEPQASFEPPPQPKGMSELSRIGGVYFEPKTAFADIAARPTWLVPTILVIVVSLAVSYLISTHVGWERIISQQLAASPNSAQMTAEQRQTALNFWGKFGPLLGYGGSILFPPIMYLFMAAVLMAMVAGILSTPVKFQQVLAVVSWASLPKVLMAILTGVVIMMKNPDELNIKNPLAFNPGAFMDPLTSSKFLYAVATSLDLFTIWIIILMAIGLKAAGGKKMSFGSALFAVVLPWLLLVLGGASIAAMFS